MPPRSDVPEVKEKNRPFNNEQQTLTVFCLLLFLLFLHPLQVDSLDTLLKTSDFVSLHVPLDATTENLMNAERVDQV